MIGELKYMKDNFGSKGIYFIDDNFTINKQRTIELCHQMRANNLDLEWAGDTRVDLLSED